MNGCWPPIDSTFRLPASAIFLAKNYCSKTPTADFHRRNRRIGSVGANGNPRPVHGDLKGFAGKWSRSTTDRFLRRQRGICRAGIYTSADGLTAELGTAQFLTSAFYFAGRPREGKKEMESAGPHTLFREFRILRKRAVCRTLAVDRYPEAF